MTLAGAGGGSRCLPPYAGRVGSSRISQAPNSGAQAEGGCVGSALRHWGKRCCKTRDRFAGQISHRTALRRPLSSASLSMEHPISRHVCSIVELPASTTPFSSSSPLGLSLHHDFRRAIVQGRSWSGDESIDRRLCSSLPRGSELRAHVFPCSSRRRRCNPAGVLGEGLCIGERLLTAARSTD